MDIESSSKNRTSVSREGVKRVDRKKSEKVFPDLPLTIALIYILLTSLAIVLLPAKFANAGFQQRQITGVHSDYLTTLTVVGRGELTWFGLSIYEASLWTRNGKYKSITDSMPIALSITYARDIDSEALAKRTVEEWVHLGIFETDERETWGKRLRQIWPNVKPGDSIVTLVTEDKVTRFYHNDKFLSELNDPTFGKALLSIWLDPNTSEPVLREKLIGLRGEK